MTSALLVPAGAAESGEPPPEEEKLITLGQLVELPAAETSAEPGIQLFSAADGTVDAASGTHEKWFDRIDTSGAPYAQTFWNVLEEAVDNDGTNDYFIEDTYFTKNTKDPVGDFSNVEPGTFVKSQDFNGILFTTVTTNIPLTEDPAEGTVPAVDVQQTVENLKEFQYVSELLGAVYNAFDRDHPEVFWLTGTSKMYWDLDMPYYEGDKSATATIYIFFLTTTFDAGYDIRESGYDESSIKAAITARDAKITSLVNTAKAAGSDPYDQIAKLNETLTKTNIYNSDATTWNDAQKAANKHLPWKCLSGLRVAVGSANYMPVCEGYARAFKVVCDKLGIPCVLVDGHAKNASDSAGEAHMWNYVQLTKDSQPQWYAVDVTWNDPVVNNVTNVESGYETDKWLALGGNTNVGKANETFTFITSHPVANTVSTGGFAFTNGPELSTEAYKNTLPALEGTVTVTPSDKTIGTELTASFTQDSSITDTVAPAYQWYRDGKTIDGATSEKYTLAVADLGANITVRVTAENFSSYVESSPAIGPVEQKDCTADAPVISKVEATDTTVTVTATGTGLEYAIAEGSAATAPATGWQPANEFTGLKSGTDYIVFVRVAETADTKAGTEVSQAAKTKGVLTANDFTVTQPVSNTYTGNPISVTVAANSGITGTGTITTYYEGTGSTSYAKSTNPPTNAGTYKVTVDVAAGTDYVAASGLAVGSLTIEQVVTSINAADVTVTKGQNKTITATVENGPADAAVTYESDDPATATVGKTDGKVTGVELGETNVTITYAGNNNYNGSTKTVKVTVTNKELANVTFTVKDTGETPYTGSNIEIKDKFDAAASDQAGGTITYEYDGTTYDALSDLPAVKNVGKYTVKAVYESATHYGEATAVFEVIKAEQAVLTISSANTMKYKDVLTLTTEGGSGTGAVTYTVANGTGAATLDGSKLTATKVGTVTVTAVKKGDSNYNDGTAVTATITIGKADSPANVTLEQKAQYYASTGTVTLTGGPSDMVNPRYAYTAYTDANTVLKAAPTVSGNKLSYELTAGLTENDAGKKASATVTVSSDNYGDFDITVNITISAKEDQRPLTITSTRVTYPNNLTLTVSGGTINGAVTYEVTAGGDVATIMGSVLTPLKAGKVTVVATMAGNDEYNEVVSDPTEITIEKGTPKVVPVHGSVTSSGKTLADVPLTTGAGTSPAGTIQWLDAPTTSITANTRYYWSFTPDDTANWNPVTGSIILWDSDATTPGSGSGSSGNYGGDSDGSGGGYDSSSGSGTGTVTTGSTTSGGERVTATTATPTAAVSNGAASTTVSDSMGKRVVDQAVRNDSDTVIIAPKVDRTVKSTEVTIPASTVQDIGSRTGADLQVNSPVANVVIPNGALTSLASGGSVTVSASRNGSTVSVDVSVNGRTVDRINGGVTAQVSASNCTSGTVAMLVASNGSTKVIRKSIADPANGTVSVPLDGSAQLVITSNSRSFTDVPATNWAASAVAFISSHEIMNGTDADTFSPSAPMTRGMLAAVLHNIEDNPRASGTIHFSDVGSSWYSNAVQWAAGEGIVSGYSDGRFGPNDMVTREQLAVMLYRYAGQPGASTAALSFSDADQVSGWAEDAIRWAVGAGILSGDGSRLTPGGQATRAEAASMIMRFMRIMDK